MQQALGKWPTSIGIVATWLLGAREVFLLLGVGPALTLLFIPSFRIDSVEILLVKIGVQVTRLSRPHEWY